ncbi:alpha/beta-Hydrolase [Glarea lozoyensis ATCC 20868]|uniref:Alpha/beta-Hydrolase n=1 Tax=Glarea lozoyensis (strain ATCC 20868 / MF5171) TaxID=1116229 RepID=S3D2W3_GLAL2|nr:alpha/beta-Hydrolase [Glarea lozoyensis ATCC 20868]EPE31509.1 alpha/beta-Hydrolase [Glarea lozoyensis ATCC 20868]
MGDSSRTAEEQYFPLQDLRPATRADKGRQHRPAKMSTNEGYDRAGSPASPKEECIQPLQKALPSPQDNDVFPPMPLYEQPLRRQLKSLVLRPVAFTFTLCCLSLIFSAAMIDGAKVGFKHAWARITFHDPDAGRPFLQEEKRRAALRREDEQNWKGEPDLENKAGLEYIPTEGGKDPVKNDVAYYARRVGLDVETFRVQTEDGMLLNLHHVYDPKEHKPLSDVERAARGPKIFTNAPPSRPIEPTERPKFPVLMIHGLMQSAGTFTSHDDNSLAFYLCKSGYDVWLGTNRCGFKPEHAFLKPSDPRMWTWSPRDMGNRDLPAFTSRVLSETGFQKLGLVCHSQGTTQTFIALSKDQRPDLGSKFTVFCALAPAVYAGPLLKRWYFSFVTSLSPFRYSTIFGIHAFIPLMMPFQRLLPGRVFGAAGYRMFNYLFGWSDRNWDRGLRDRGFQCSPTYISSESMRWWLGKNGFAKNGCILASEAETQLEAQVDAEMDKYKDDTPSPSHVPEVREIRPWYDHRAPPMAFWAAGKDELVDGRRLLKRFGRGREPDVRVVHSELIDEYEHLDVIWAMDIIDRVGRGVKDTLWMTCDVRDKVRIPKGCENVGAWNDTGRIR